MGVIYQLNHTNIGRTAALLYQVLRELACAEGSKRRGYVYASRATLASYCRCSDRTISRAIRELEAASLIRDVRMGRGLNNRIYVNVQSRPDKTSVSQYNSTETNSSDISIHPTNRTEAAPEARQMDGYYKRVETVKAEHAVVRPRQAEGQPLAAPMGKGKPTPKRPRNDRKERRKAARAQYADALRKRLFYGESGRTLAFLDDDGTRSAAAETAITMLSDALAAGRNFKVAGTYLTPGQFWDVVQYLDLAALESVLDRVNHADNVRNLTGYLYASLYNECAYRRLSAQVV